MTHKTKLMGHDKRTPFAFQSKNTVIILIKVADFESDIGFYYKGLVSEMFALTPSRKITSSTTTSWSSTPCT